MDELEYFWPLVFGLAYFGALGLIWAFIHGAALLRDAKDRRTRCLGRSPDRRKSLYNYWGIK